MKYGLRLVENDSQIRKMILESLRDEVSNTINRALPKIQNNIRSIVKQAIENSPEYSSLLKGNLRLELGIPDAESRVNTIINTWISNISIENKPIKVTNNGLSGGFSLAMIASDFADVLALSASSITDESNGYTIPWLEWLLLAGGKVIIKDYIVVFGSNKASRTGYAIMKQSPGNSWRVPPEFAGTVSNNWITRAIDSLDDSITTTIQTEIESYIS